MNAIPPELLDSCELTAAAESSKAAEKRRAPAAATTLAPSTPPPPAPAAAAAALFAPPPASAPASAPPRPAPPPPLELPPSESACDPPERKPAPPKALASSSPTALPLPLHLAAPSDTDDACLADHLASRCEIGSPEAWGVATAMEDLWGVTDRCVEISFALRLFLRFSSKSPRTLHSTSPRRLVRPRIRHRISVYPCFHSRGLGDLLAHTDGAWLAPQAARLCDAAALKPLQCVRVKRFLEAEQRRLLAAGATAPPAITPPPAASAGGGGGWEQWEWRNGAAVAAQQPPPAAGAVALYQPIAAVYDATSRSQQPAGFFCQPVLVGTSAAAPPPPPPERQRRQQQEEEPAAAEAAQGAALLSPRGGRFGGDRAAPALDGAAASAASSSGAGGDASSYYTFSGDWAPAPPIGRVAAAAAAATTSSSAAAAAVAAARDACLACPSGRRLTKAGLSVWRPHEAVVPILAAQPTDPPAETMTYGGVLVGLAAVRAHLETRFIIRDGMGQQAHRRGAGEAAAATQGDEDELDAAALFFLALFCGEGAGGRGAARRVAATGGVGAVAGVMRARRGCDAVQEQGCRALRAVAAHGGTEGRWAVLGVVPEVR